MERSGYLWKLHCW